MCLSAWTYQEWTDPRLIWNPANYTGLSNLVVPGDWIWQPTILLSNSANGDYFLPKNTELTVQSDGTVINTPPAIFETPCQMTIRYFPFDVQTCRLVFTIWQYDTQQITFNNGERMGLKSSTKNSEWSLMDSSTIIANYTSEKCNISWSTMTFELKLERKPLYYVINIVIPCLVMALLTCLIFVLPSESGEKMSFSVSMLIAISVFTLLVADIMPETSKSVPLIAQFLLFDMGFVASCITASIFVLNVYHRPKKDLAMSSLVRKVFIEQLPYWLCMKPCPTMVHNDASSFEKKVLPLDGAEQVLNGKSAFAFKNVAFENGDEKTEVASDRNEMSTTPNNSKNNIEEILAEIVSIKKRLHGDDKEKSMEEDWKYVAMVMDRLFLLIGLSTYIAGILVIFGPETIA
ncbi:neuronal acetylcholine receptor subunit beta-4-like [Glandiceps talaboti]